MDMSGFSVERQKTVSKNYKGFFTLSNKEERYISPLFTMDPARFGHLESAVYQAPCLTHQREHPQSLTEKQQNWAGGQQTRLKTTFARSFYSKGWSNKWQQSCYPCYLGPTSSPRLVKSGETRVIFSNVLQACVISTVSSLFLCLI